MNKLLTFWGVLVLSLMAMLYGLAPAHAAIEPTYEDRTWTSDMNQESYWLPWQCTKYSNHNGWIPAQYDAAIIKDASTIVRVYANLENVGAFQGTHPQKPNGGQFSWVMKCTKPPVDTTTTTTSTTITTTTQPETTTTWPESTTTSSTQPPATTTTVIESTSTSSPTTSLPPETTPTTSPVTEPPSTPPTPDTPPLTPTLPDTGTSSWLLAGLAALFLSAGGGSLAIARRK